MTAPLLLSRLAPPTAVPFDPTASVLVVDDTPGKRFALKAALLPLGHRIVEADSGLAALRCVMKEDFAVILLDVRMPDMDGFQTATLIRQRRQSELTPIIFITAQGRDEIDQTDRYAEGAVDFIFAPVQPGELRAKVSVFANLFVQARVLARAARQLTASVDQLRTLADAAPVGIFQTDALNRHTYTNLKWTEITGISPERAIGQPWDLILPPAQRAALAAEIAEGIIDPADLCHRYKIWHPATAAERVVLVTAKAIPAAAADAGGWVGILADVTAEAEAEAAMATARDAALATTKMQQHFTAAASHELKTPTSAILGYLEEVLESETLSPEDRDFLEVAYRNAQRLSRLIDDLLIVGRTDSGDLVMHLQRTPLVALVERVVSSFSGEAERRGVDLVVESEPGSLAAMVDPLRLEQALVNLVSNALKFTPEGGEVKITVHRAGETVELGVADTGAGIDPADVDNIFERFYRTKTALDAGVKGSGLGLAIAKGMVEAQNGTMRVTSVLGRGSTFTMNLPVDMASTAASDE